MDIAQRRVAATPRPRRKYFVDASRGGRESGRSRLREGASVETGARPRYLSAKSGEDYALHVLFTIRTAVELHRAWHMTLLTSKLMQQLKDRFQLRTTWQLGVLRLRFRMEDGDYEINRKVLPPRGYSSEATPRPRRGCSVAMSRGDAAAATRMIRRDEPRPRRGYFAETSCGRDADDS